MVLQYKGYNNNWFYEDAEQIGFATVYLGDVIKNFKNNTEEDGIEFFKHLDSIINNHIEEETHCESPKFMITEDIKMESLKNVYVIMLTGENKNKTYVFTKGVYLLNNSGKTIQKIC